jgi:putative ABC transport system ATP-binding protein
MIMIKNINKDYYVGNEEVHALKNVQLQINKGEFVAIVGASGSGKSTLMNILGCLDVPDSGEYYLDDVNVLKLNDNKLAQIRNSKIGFVFQSSNLLPRLTAIENVELPLIYRNSSKKERKEKSIRSLEMVGLLDRIHHKPNQLSGGQQQRTAIARAIASEPEIILADEPTGNLDSKSGKEIMNILVNLNNRGKTIVLISHDSSIANYAKRILRISDGELNEEVYPTN